MAGLLGRCAGLSRVIRRAQRGEEIGESGGIQRSELRKNLLTVIQEVLADQDSHSLQRMAVRPSYWASACMA